MRGSSVDYDASSEEGVGIPRALESVTSRIRMEDSAKLYEVRRRRRRTGSVDGTEMSEEARDSREANSL